MTALLRAKAPEAQRAVIARPMAGPVLQRKCGCGGETFGSGECAACRKKRVGTLQRSAIGGGTTSAAPPIVHDVLREPGQPLDRATREFMEPRFGRDLSAVRVHAGPRAAASAAAVDAHAYTVGRSIVLGEGAGMSPTGASHRLLGHELAHTVQQGFTSAPPRDLAISTDAATERQAERTGTLVAAGGAAGTLSPAPMSGVQREEAKPAGAPPPDAELGWIETSLIEAVATPALALGNTPYRMVKAMLRGLAIEVKTQAKAKGPAFLEKLKEMLTSPKQVGLFVLHYWWGLVKGIFSPITGLFDLAKLAVKLQQMQAQVLSTVFTRRAQLADQAGKLAVDMTMLALSAKDAVDEFKKNPLKTVKTLGPWLSSLASDAEAAAESGGRRAGSALMSALDKPLPELGEIAGEIVGTVLVNVVLLVFTEGIGNAVTQVATKLGEFGSYLGKFGKAAQMLGTLVTEIAELLGTVGGWITKAETAIAKLAEAVLKPLSPVLERFGKVVSGLRSFLRDLLGLAEEGAATGAETAAGAAARQVEGRVTPAVKVVEPPKPVIKANVPPASAAEEGIGAASATTAPKSATKAAPKVSADVVPPPAASRARVLEGVSRETEDLLASRPGLRKVLEEHPNAADLFKLCESPCFPSFLTDEEMAVRLLRLERMETEAAKYGVKFKRGPFKKLLHKQESIGDVDATLDAIENGLSQRIRSSWQPTPGGESPAGLAGPGTNVPPRARVPANARPQFEGAGDRPPTGYEDLFDSPEISAAKTPGGRTENPRTFTGKFVDRNIEALQQNPAILDDIANRGGGAAPMFDHQLPQGLIPEYGIPHPTLPNRPRIDRLWRQGETIFEIKPNTFSAELGEAQAQQYAEWMNRLEPLPNGRLWQYRVVQYDQTRLMSYLRNIGVLPP